MCVPAQAHHLPNKEKFTFDARTYVSEYEKKEPASRTNKNAQTK